MCMGTRTNCDMVEPFIVIPYLVYEMADLYDTKGYVQVQSHT